MALKLFVAHTNMKRNSGETCCEDLGRDGTCWQTWPNISISQLGRKHVPKQPKPGQISGLLPPSNLHFPQRQKARFSLPRRQIDGQGTGRPVSTTRLSIFVTCRWGYRTTKRKTMKVTEKRLFRAQGTATQK